MVMARWSVLLVLVGCPNDDTGDGSASGDTGEPISGTDHGSVVLAAWLPSGAEPNPELTLEGLFTQDPQPYANLAQCVLSARAFCFDALPAKPGESVVTATYDGAILEDLVTRDLGRKITLGPWKATFNLDASSEVGYYLEQWAETSIGGGPLGLGFSKGAWGGYAGTADVPVPSPMVVTSPNPLQVLDFFDNAPIDLTWEVPAGVTGDVYLYYSTPVEDRLIRLEDTGAYALDLRPLALHEGDTVDLVLGRWTGGSVLHNGNTAKLLVQANQPLRGSWRTNRTVLVDVYDQCVAAQTAPATPPGNYTGSLLGAYDDLDPGEGGCTGFQAAGVDRIVPIDLLDQDLLTVDYQLLANDASVYLLSDCTTTASCLVGADAAGVGEEEALVWFNDSGGDQRVYLVLDAYSTVTDDFNLDIRIDSLAQEVLLPTCVDAIEQGPIDSGSYHGTVAGNADNLNPACAEGTAPGGEGIAMVRLGPGETLSASVEAPGADPKLYLLANCSIGDSCFLFADVDADTTEEIVYVNASGFTQNMYLALDAGPNLGEYFLELAIE